MNMNMNMNDPIAELRLVQPTLLGVPSHADSLRTLASSSSSNNNNNMSYIYHHSSTYTSTSTSASPSGNGLRMYVRASRFAFFFFADRIGYMHGVCFRVMAAREGEWRF